MPPVVLALLACDRVARTIRAGRADLLGVFHAASLPLPAYLSFAVFYVITGTDEPATVTLTGQKHTAAFSARRPSIPFMPWRMAIARQVMSR